MRRYANRAGALAARSSLCYAGPIRHWPSSWGSRHLAFASGEGTLALEGNMDELTPGRRFYNDHVSYLEANDVDGLVNSHYNLDAEMIGFDFVVRGHAALRQQFRRYLNSLGQLRLKSTDRFVETGDAIFFESTITANQGDIRVYDAFVLKGGKISVHFTGIKD
jgi:SnoaL-like domain